MAEIRSLGVIAHEVRRDWRGPAGESRVWFGAKPYLDAMATLYSVRDNYGADSAASVVRYFLANAAQWRGPVARRVKAELKAMVAGVY